MIAVLVFLAILASPALALWPALAWRTPGARWFSAVMLFLVAAWFAAGAGEHICLEGGTPPFVVLAAGVTSGAGPFLLATPGKRLAFVFAACVGWAAAASFLTETYHGSAYTGNPERASGRLWHTPFTGLYPRAPREP